MHIHSPETEPYTSSQDAIYKYPERCTAIGKRLSNHNQVDLFTPFGIEDIVNFHIHATPHFEENPERMQVYKQRLAKKNWQNKWPKLQIID